jgi:type I restriction enzyme M protein
MMENLDKQAAQDLFNQFGDDLWEVANVMRDDALHSTERLEIFSLFLFLKLWDDQIRVKEEVLGEKIAEANQLIPEKYRFHHWAKNPDDYAKKLGFNDGIDFCRHLFDDLAVLNSRHESAYDVRRLFDGANFKLRYSATIRALTSKLAELPLHDILGHQIGEGGERFDIFGRAYEYLLQKFGQNKEFAEYFTPRHIVDHMVGIIDPQIGERIYDPACGTGGFIVRAFQHVKKHIESRKNTLKGPEIEQLTRELKEKNLWGVEHVPLVYKLSLMNMILHGDGKSQLKNDDSLSNKAQELHKGQYDVILANPPFGKTKQERIGTFKHDIKLYEALFIQHMMNALKPGGRAAVVLKEGLFFDSKKVLRAICRELVEQFEVLAVLSLPNGVFNPYSGVKTSIVVFRRPLNREDVRTSKVWFYRVDSDGRDLGATRRPLPDFETDGDLRHMSEHWPYRWLAQPQGGVRAVLKDEDLRRFETPRSWWATLEDLRKTGYNLTAGRYCPHQAEAVEHETPEVLINRLLELEDDITSDLRDLLVLVSGEEVSEIEA